jgi:hypothetical protein
MSLTSFCWFSFSDQLKGASEDRVLICRSLTQRAIVLDEKPKNKSMAAEFHLSQIFEWDSVHPSYWNFGMSSDELSKPKQQQDNASVSFVGILESFG